MQQFPKAPMKSIIALQCVLAHVFLNASPPALPEPPIILHGMVTDKATNQPVAITSVVWQVTDGSTNRSYGAASLPATRVVDGSGQSFYALDVPQETRVVQAAGGGGGITLQPGANGFEVRTPAPTYTLTAIINGVATTIKAVDGANSPSGTASATFNDYTPPTQGRMMRVDLWINEDPYLTWAAGYFPNPNAPHAAPGFDYDGDGQTNEQERLAGTDPTNGTSSLRLMNFSRASNGTSFSLTWSSVPGKTYQAETSQTLLSGQWSPIDDPVTATAATSALTVPMSPTDPRRFFRVRLLP